MTFSIVASNPGTKELCVATSTCLVAVGDLVPCILPNVGAICVQAMVKPSYREIILDLMKIWLDRQFQEIFVVAQVTNQ